MTTVSRWTTIGMLCLIVSSNVEAAKTAHQRLQQDFQTGRISYIQKLTCEGYWIFDPTRLPEPYLGLQFEVAKCGTGIICALKDNWDKLNPEDQAFFTSFLQRPDYLPETYNSPNGRFKLHYTTTGYHAVLSGDEDQNGIPDFIEQAGIIFEYCWDFEVDTLGYQPPPNDSERGGGDEVDVYFHDINAYGYTIPENPIPSTPYNDYSCYIKIDNDFASSGYHTHGLDALRVTAAHEFFHVIQFGYHYRDYDRFFMEMSSTWMEDIVYDEVNDYHGYLSKFFDYPYLPLTLSNDEHEYGACIWLHFLSERFDRDIVRQMWGEIRRYNAVVSMEEALQQRRSSLCEEFATFAIWNYFTGSRAEAEKFYREAVDYPEIYISESYSFTTNASCNDFTAFLSTKYYNFTPQKPGYFQLQQEIDPSFSFRTGLITPVQISVLDPKTRGEIGHVSSQENIIVVPINCHVPVEYWTYQSRAKKYPFHYSIVTQQISGCDKVWPNPFVIGQHQKIVVKFNLAKESSVDFCIFTENGRKVKTFPLGLAAPGPAVAEFDWDGTLDNGDCISSGVYIATICGDGMFMSNKLAVIRK